MLRPIAFLILAVFCLSFGSVIAKGLLTGGFGISIPDIEPLPFLASQFVGSLGFLFVVVSVNGKRLDLGRSLKGLAVAGTILGVGSVGTIMALVFIPVGEASVIFATQPILIIGLAWLLLSERMDAVTLLLGAVAIAGVLVIVLNGETDQANNRALGALFATFSTVSAALYFVWMRRLSATTDTLSATIIVQFTAFTVVVVVWVTARVFGMDVGGFPPASSFSAAAVSGLCYYGLGFYIFLLGLKHIEAGRAGLYLNLVPVFTIALAYVLLGERLTLVQWIGAAIVLCAVVAISKSALPKRT